jgi:FKBP-type peptidyl-prolyl cis-trans isomerase
MKAFRITMTWGLMLSASLAAAGAEPAQDFGGSDPAVAAFTPSSAKPAAPRQVFPLSAYSAIGSSFAQNGRFAELGWDDAQFNALLHGMFAAFQGRVVPMDATSQRLAAETSRRIAELSARGGARDPSAAALPSSAPQAFPLPAYSAFGSSLVQTGHFAELGWNDAQFSSLLDGMRATFHGIVVPSDDASKQLAAETGRRIVELVTRERQEAAEALDPKARLARYFKVMRQRLELQVSDSGLGYNVEPADRNGVRPSPGDTIVLTCRVTGADGVTKLPQLSAEHIRVKMEGMLPGLMEGLQMLTVGSSAIFVIPPSLSFGDNPWPEGVERDSPLVYNVTLHDVESADATP